MSDPDVVSMDNYDPNKIYVTVAVPTHEMVPYQFAFDLANMIGFTIHASQGRVVIQTLAQAGTYVHRARQQIIDGRGGAHYLLWVDSDMRFPKDALLRLLERKEDMVGINYSTRGIPPRFVAIKRVSVDHPEEGGMLCATWPDSTGLEEVEAIGFGFVLMKTKIIPDLPDNGTPLFWYGLDGDGKELHVGEDVWFCRLVRKAGYRVFVDHDLSKECAHVGQMEYRIEHAQEMYRMVEEDNPDGDHLVYGAKDSSRELAEQERPDQPDS